MSLPDDATVDERLDHLDVKFLQFRDDVEDRHDRLESVAAAARDAALTAREAVVELRESVDDRLDAVEAALKVRVRWGTVAKAAGTFAGGALVALAPEHAAALKDVAAALLGALAGGG